MKARADLCRDAAERIYGDNNGKVNRPRLIAPPDYDMLIRS